MPRTPFPAGEYFELERLVDMYGLDVVLKKLADVCYDKSMVEDVYSKRSRSANAWKSAGKKLYTVASKVKGL